MEYYIINTVPFFYFYGLISFTHDLLYKLKELLFKKKIEEIPDSDSDYDYDYDSESELEEISKKRKRN